MIGQPYSGKLTVRLDEGRVDVSPVGHRLLPTLHSNVYVQSEAAGKRVMASLERRRERGEKVLKVNAEDVSPFLLSGAAQIFQAVLEGEVVSSILLLMAPKGAYYQSAGTTPKGMASGASHFLIYETALRLRPMGLEVFNLGGEHEPGLQRFKTGFGTREVALEAAEFLMEGKTVRGAKAAARLLRRLMP